MSLTYRGGIACLRKPLMSELANRLQHPKALVNMPNKALLDERLQRVEVCVGDLCCGFDRAAAWKDGEAREEPFLVGRKQVVGPFDRRPQRLLPRFRIASTPQQVEPLG